MITNQDAGKYFWIGKDREFVFHIGSIENGWADWEWFRLDKGKGYYRDVYRCGLCKVNNLSTYAGEILRLELIFIIDELNRIKKEQEIWV